MVEWGSDRECGTEKGSISQEAGGEKVFTKITEMLRLGEDVWRGGEDAESWDVGDSLTGLIGRGHVFNDILVGFIKCIDERKMMRVNNASLAELQVVK